MCIRDRCERDPRLVSPAVCERKPILILNPRSDETHVAVHPPCVRVTDIRELLGARPVEMNTKNTGRVRTARDYAGDDIRCIRADHADARAGNECLRFWWLVERESGRRFPWRAVC